MQTIKTLIKMTGILSSLLFISMNANAAKFNKPMMIGNFDFKITVPVDTTNISAIQVNLASTDSTVNDLLNYTFQYGSSSGLPTGIAYKRVNTIVYLTLGNFAVGAKLYGTYSVIDKSGNALAPKTFMYK